MGEMSISFLPLLLLLGIVAVILAINIVRKPVNGIYIFIFLSSITITPSLPIVKDRLVIADFVMILTLLICMYRGQLFGKAPKELRQVDNLGLLFVYVASFTSLIAMMLEGDILRACLFLLIYIYGYLCFRLIIRMINTSERFVRVCFWYAAGATLVILVGILASSGIYKPSWTYDPIIMRISSTMKLSGQVSSYVGPAMFILLYLSVVVRSLYFRLFAIGILCAGGVVLLGTGSRISFVIFIFVIIYGMLSIKLTSIPYVRILPLIFAAIVGSAIFISYSVSVWSDTSEKYSLITTSPFERAVKIFSENAQNDDGLDTWGGTRYSEISTAFKHLDQHFFVGTGSGLFSGKYRINEIHDTYISILAENGFFAFLIFIFWWGSMLFLIFKNIRVVKNTNKLIAKFILGAFLVLSLYQMTTNGMRQRPFWFIPAIAVSSIAILRQKRIVENN